LSGGWRHAVAAQAPDDLADGVPAGGVVGEDSPHDGGFRFEDHQSGRAGRVAGYPLVAVGDAPGQDLPGAGAEQLSAPVPFGDLRAFVLGDDALDLGE
jgi:hypothetical protein